MTDCALARKMFYEFKNCKCNQCLLFYFSFLFCAMPLDINSCISTEIKHDI